MDSVLGSPLNVLKSGSATRKRPFNVVGSLVPGYLDESPEDYNILSSMGMKDRDIFKSSETNNAMMKFDETMENFKVPTGTIGGQSPYFKNASTPKKSLQDSKPRIESTEEVKKVTTNILVTQKEQMPSATKKEPEPTKKPLDSAEDIKPRKLRPVGEFSTSSLDKEYQDLMEFMKQEREKDQLLFIKCSKALRDRVWKICKMFHLYANCSNLLQFFFID